MSAPASVQVQRTPLGDVLMALRQRRIELVRARLARLAAPAPLPAGAADFASGYARSLEQLIVAFGALSAREQREQVQAMRAMRARWKGEETVSSAGASAAFEEVASLYDGELRDQRERIRTLRREAEVGAPAAFRRYAAR